MIEKPEFPPARLIREDFLLPYKKYRIKKVIEYGQTLYYPQKKVLWWWNDVFGFGRYNFGGHFRTLEEAKKALHEKVYGTKNIEYIYDLD
jgi:hypothetical protein